MASSLTAPRERIGDQNQIWTLASGLVFMLLLLTTSTLAQPASPPSLSIIPDQGVFPNCTSRPIAFVIGDAGTPANLLSLSALSANTNLVPNNKIIFGGSASNRTATIIPATNQTGATTITISVTDTNGGAASNSFAFDVAWFTPVASGIPYLAEARFAWGDCDNDGLPDLLANGYDAGAENYITRIYRNLGGNLFADLNAGLSNAYRAGLSWVDYNRDGYLDVLVADGTTQLYRNVGGSSFAPVASGLPNLNLPAAAWGDFDNDGDPDLALLGTSGDGFFPLLYRNNSDDTFTGLTNALPLLYLQYGFADWGDFDNDGDLDLALSGREVSFLTKVYRNDGKAGFIEIAALLGVYNSCVRWGDYDNDGDLDILLTGGVGDVQPSARIYRNNGNQTFTDIGAGLTGVTLSSSDWGDFDNDGDLDAVIAGYGTNSLALARIYVNNSNQTFAPLPLTISANRFGSVAWADTDRDGDLDLLVYGESAIQLYRNNAPSNAPPLAPTGLNITTSTNGDVTFKWNASTDSRTASAGLGYNLRVGTNSGGLAIVAPQADPATGMRRVAQPGLTHTNRWKISDLPKGTYFWSVQAVDTALAGSPFATEQSFTLTNAPPKITVAPEVHTGPAALVSLPFTVTDAESAATQIVVTAQSVNSVFIPPAGIALSGTGSARTVTFRIGGGQLGTNELILQARDPQGFFREERVRVVSEFFTVTPLFETTNFYSLTPLHIGWGYPYGNPVVDVDRDGDLDVLFSATVWSNNYIVGRFVIASNDGFGNFSFNTVSNTTLPTGSDVYWFDDFNRDGVVDLIGAGTPSGGEGMRLLAGDGMGGFGPGQSLGATFLTLLADLDNDGDLDGLGLPSSPTSLKYFQNSGGQFRARPGPPVLSFTTYQESWSARLADLDNDGDIDFFISGEGTNLSQRLVIRTLRNNGSGRFAPEEYPVLPGPASMYGTYIYDADDDRDLDVTFQYETNYSGPILRGMGANNGSGAFYFTTNISVPGAFGGDFDNDGDLDRWISEVVSVDPYRTVMRLSFKIGTGQYVPQGIAMSDSGMAADFDGDGDLDYLVTTPDYSPSGIVVSPERWKFFRNNTDRTNAPPAVPAGLTATQRTDDRITFSWNAATDDHTPTNWMSYNLRVGTTSGGVQIISPCANLATGRRWLSGEGNVGALTFRDLRGLPSGTYYWSVQAVDGVFAASAWSPEQSITIVRPSISPLADVVTPPGIASKPISFSVTGGASPVNSLTITVVADDPTLIPNTGLVVTGTGTNRTLTITPGNRSGDTDLTLTATDLAGFSAIVRCHIRVAWWDAAPLEQIGIQRFEQWRWVDSDLDGRLDFFGYTPVGNATPQLFSFHNLGGAQFESVSNNLPGWTSYPVEVAGFGGDNLADVLTLQRPDSSTSLLQVWQGTGAGFQFVPLTEVSNRSWVAQHLWLDVDNDGWRDVVHTGWVTPAPSNAPAWALLIARGKPDGTFEYLPQRICMYSGGVIAAADFDLDGDFDLVVAGTDYAANGQDAGTNFLRVYLNEGGGRFTPNPAGLPQAPSFYKASVADFDSDGWPDLLLTPYVTGTDLPRLMRNVGGTFVETPSALPTALDVTTWADFDNDGDLDLLGVCSVDLSYIDFGPSSAAVFRNNAGVLSRADAGLPAIAAHHASFADADNDGDLDLLISGETGWNVTGRFLCLNSSVHSNTPPPAPTALSPAYGYNGALLQWTAGADAESGTALTYNLRVGTTPGGSEVMSAAADPVTGQRRLTGMGNIGHAPRWRLFPSDGTYYWTVQAIDAGFAASSFTPEASFTYYHPTLTTFTNVLLFPGTGPSVQSFTVGDPDSAAASLMMSAFASNTNLLPMANITFSGTGSNRFVSVFPANGFGGTSLVSVVVTDVTGLTATNSFTLTVDYFSERALSLPNGGNGTPSFADYDGDGDLDLYLAGKIFRNDGGTNFVSVATVLAGQRHGVAWADYDRDGDLDLAVAGGGPTKIYRNNGAGVFTDSGAVIPDQGNAAIAWGDYDNDGDLDLVTLGAGLIYRNDGTNGFVGISAGLPGVGESSVAWGDFDNDGYQDVLLAGFQGPSTTVGGIYRNNHNGYFTNIGAAIPGFHGASVSWGDYDNDGFLDVLVCGVWSSFQVHVIHNNHDGTFTNINLSLPGVGYGFAQWVDFDNDGRLDIFLCGNVSNFPNLDYASYLYRNNGDGTFSDTQAGLPKGSTATWGDLDGDTDLDLIVSGSGIDFYRLLQNNCPTPNSLPVAPSGLLATLLPDNNVLLSWLPASDLENTNPPSLNYVLQAGLTPGGAGLVSPHAAHPGGFRRLPERGPLNTNSRFLRDVPRGTYYWSVQAIDAGLAGSPFSAGGTFTISNARPIISAISNQLTVPGRTTAPISFTVSDFETAATNLTLNGYSTNTAIMPDANIVFGGVGSNRTVTLTTLPGVSGTTTIIIGVTDGGGLVATSRFDVVVQIFTEVSVGLPATTAVPSAWGDYDNDGDLDVAIAGPSYTTVYRNTNGIFTNQNFTLPSAVQYLTPTDLAWIDYDNDGDLDLTESGWISAGYQTVTFRFRNNFPTNTFISTNLPGGITNIADGAMAWGDYDNDGDLDVLLSGDTNTYHSPDAFTALYRNDRGVFTNSGVTLPALVRGAAVWGDYDNDGDLDLLIAGQTGTVTTNSVTKLFRNDGNGVFNDIAALFPGITDCALAFGDIDNDGDLDIAMAGTGTNTALLTRIYRNTGSGIFTNLNANLLGVTYASVGWGDYDNDGFAELVVSGSTNTSPFSPAAATTTVYRNYGGVGFTNIGGALPGVMMQNTSWGDADNDGDLDLLVGARFVRNNWNLPNTPPSAPTNLSFVILSNNDVRLSWSPSTDVETTNSGGLSYNLRIGTNSGGGQVVSPSANGANGYHRVPNLGNAGPTNFWRIANLTNGTYYWSVQAIDPAFAGSVFATEGSFTLSRPVISAITNRSTPPNTTVGPIAFTVSDGETTASNLVVTVSSSDTNLVPAAGLVITGLFTNRTLTITPTTNRSGIATITVTALDESGQAASRSFLLTVERFADIAAGLSAAVGAVTWGDYDNDGDLDFVRGATIYRNNGNGTFTDIAAGLLSSGVMTSAWGDYDNDGDLDLVIAGQGIRGVYRNDGNDVFTAVIPNGGGNANTSLAWGDYDNDGDLDFLFAYSNYTYPYRNDGSNVFTQINPNLPIVNVGSVAWGDYDKDGRLDILLAGNNLLRVHRNSGNGSFALLTPELPGIYQASVAWGDFDNDGDLDFVVCGSTNNSVNGVTTRIYRNNTNTNPNLFTFTNIYPVAAQGPVGVWKGAVAWGDYDNDGDLDLLVTGETLINNAVPLTKIYRNDNGAFTDSGLTLPALRNSFAAWGDFDSDGSLDLALSGNDAVNASVARIYRNYANGISNVPPNAPAGLTNIVTGKSARFTWTAPTDPNQAGGLSYNLRVGSAPGAGNVFSPMSATNGARRLVGLGNANERLTWTITNLTGGAFYWSVQAVDHSFAGSAFAAERSFTISNRVPVANTLSTATTEDTTRAITLTGSDPDADPITFNIASSPSFGQLSGTPPNLTYRPATNYFGFDQFTYRANDRTTDSVPAVVFIEVSPVEDVLASSMGIQPLPGGLVQLMLTGEPWRSYRIEVSEDLTHWTPLTNVIGTNLITTLIDADVAMYPHRFYRAALFVAVPLVGSSLHASSNQFQFTITGEASRGYRVQASTNLTTWSPMATVFMTNSLMIFSDPDIQKLPQRFYRVISY